MTCQDLEEMGTGSQQLWYLVCNSQQGWEDRISKFLRKILITEKLYHNKQIEGMRAASKMNQEKNIKPETEEVEVRQPVKHYKRAVRV